MQVMQVYASLAWQKDFLQVSDLLQVSLMRYSLL